MKVKAYGKINLTLEVLGLRVDGYHELRSVMAKVDISDELDLELRDDDQLVLAGSREDLAYDERNLIIKAANLLRKETGCRKGAELYIKKGIPMEAGMAGGSADAAAALIGLNSLWELDLSLEALFPLAARLGSDVPFCLQEGCVLAEGRGERLTSLPTPPPLDILVVKPDFGSSTPVVFREWDRQGSLGQEGASSLLVQALASGKNIRPFLYNGLEAAARTLAPEVGEILDEMRLQGAYAILSGSGPTCLYFGDNASIDSLYLKYSKMYKEVYKTRLR